MNVEHILDEDYVLRRIYHNQHNDSVIDSSAFSDRNDRPSVHVQRLADLAKIVAIHKDFDFFYRLKVKDIRNAGHDVIHEPDKQNDDISHCVILPSEGKWTKSKLKGLAGKGNAPLPGERVEKPVVDYTNNVGY